jgi:predicted O-linked N-acetylglucosamine transferase (SPINDLY family)
MTTTCDLLWIGVPVLTLSGEQHRARVGATLLATAGLNDLVSRTHDEFCDVATALALDLSRLRELRMTLRQRMNESPLCGEQGVTRAFENALTEMWRRWME